MFGIRFMRMGDAEQRIVLEDVIADEAELWVAKVAGRAALAQAKRIEVEGFQVIDRATVEVVHEGWI